MNERDTSRGDRSEHERYAIRVAGQLDPRWSTWFDGLTVRREGDGTTVLIGVIADQAALHGLLQRVRDLGLQLISVTRAELDQFGSPSDPGVG
jgi:hypothetical protein